MKCAVNGFGVCVPLQGAASPRCKYCGRSMLEGDRQGATYEPERDRVRLNAQMARVWEAVRDGRPHTPSELEALTGDNWASISARIRDFRKAEYGSFVVIRERLSGGLHTYRLVLPEAEGIAQ